jgi:hypothetical protein
MLDCMNAGGWQPDTFRFAGAAVEPMVRSFGAITIGETIISKPVTASAL